MKAIVVGCGRLGAELAYRLFLTGHEVSVIDLDEKEFSKLPSDFAGKFNEGDALNRDVLRRAGIEQAEAVAVVTNSDMLNATIGHLASSFYHVPNVVVRNYDPRYREIHEAFGLQLVSALSWGAQRIEEMMYHSDVRAVYSAGNGEVEVYEVSVPDSCAGYTLESLTEHEQCIPVAVTRAGKAVLPDPKMALQSGDILHLSATAEGAEALRKRIHEVHKEE